MKQMTKSMLAGVCLWLLAGTSALAQEQQEQIAISDFTSEATFRTESVFGIRWMNDGQYYSSLEDNKIVAYDIRTGKPTETIVDGDALSEKLSIDDYSLSQDEQKILLMTYRTSVYRYSYTAIFYIYDRGTQQVTLLDKGRQAYATFSPEGEKVAYVQNNNLFYYDLPSRTRVQVTDDGKRNEIINGSSDWVYEEELVLTKAFAWSQDGGKLAFYRFDEGHVKAFNMQLWPAKKRYPYDYRFKYPKAGERNAHVEVYVYHLDSKKKVPIALGQDTDIYIPRIRWTQDSDLLSIERLNRLQNVREILHADAHTGKSETILREESDTFVDQGFCDDVTYLENGRHMLYSSERSGFKHFYLYTLKGELVRPITQGNWEAEKLVGIDEKQRLLYFLSTEGSHLERHLYRVDWGGKKRVKLSKASGTHSIRMSKDCAYYIDYHSGAQQPLQVTLYEAKNNTRIKVLEDNAALARKAKTYALSKKEFFSLTSNDKQILYGYLLKPKDFDPAQQYPVLLFQYSGPGSQNVRNAWGGSHFYWHQMLAQQGYVIAVVDPRGTGGRGRAFKHITYGQLGKYEAEDHVEVAKYLGALPFIDKARIGIWGWSYGGFVSSLVLFTTDNLFKMAIAVAPVSSWRFYDTIYTERYLKRPEENAEGYDQNSPITHVEGLKGEYLLIHGTGDDNVHFQNALSLQEALIEAGKQFQSFYYPNKAHALRGAATRTHLYEMMTRFVKETL